MNTSPPHTPPQAAPPGQPTWADLFRERTPLVSAPAFFGPPIIFILGPWLLLVLLLIGPVALIFTGLLVLAVAAVLLAALAAVIASPYLVIRHLRAHRMIREIPRELLHPFLNHHAGSRRLRSLLPKGTS
jgi:hypothetical protein